LARRPLLQEEVRRIIHAECVLHRFNLLFYFLLSPAVLHIGTIFIGLLLGQTLARHV
jgi:hypothetical protein